jgi:hypothetical protein
VTAGARSERRGMGQRSGGSATDAMRSGHAASVRPDASVQSFPQVNSKIYVSRKTRMFYNLEWREYLIISASVRSIVIPLKLWVELTIHHLI